MKKKKISKKLVLGKKTVTRLQDISMNLVKAGAYTEVLCPYTYNACNTEDVSCWDCYDEDPGPGTFYDTYCWTCDYTYCC